MNGVQFRRGLVLVGIKSGLDLGAAVAAAKEADAWCAAGGSEDVLTGPAMAEMLALPAPRADSQNTAAGLNGGVRASSTPKGRRAPARGQSCRPAPAAKAASPRGKRLDDHVYEERVARALSGAWATGLTREALHAAVATSQGRLSATLKRMLETGAIERLGGKRGRGVRYRLKTKSVPTRGRSAARSSPAAGVPARNARTRSGPEGGSDEPARETVTKPAGGSISPAGSSPDPEKVKTAVLFALKRGPGDEATLAVATYYPREAVAAALKELSDAGKVARGLGNAWKRVDA